MSACTSTKVELSAVGSRPFEASVETNNITKEEEKRLVRKIDLYLMPVIFVMYLLSYMDRTNIGNAKVAGMDKDLELDSGQYSLCLVVFFIGYVIFEVPSNMLLTRTKPSIFLPTIMTLWGVATCCMAIVQNYRQLIIVRVVVGCLEAGFAPSILLIISSWYRREEQSKRFAIYISAAILSGAFGGLIAGAITENLDGIRGLHGWQWLFIVEGVATSGWAIVSSFILLDFPSECKRLNDREREVLIVMLADQHKCMEDMSGLSPFQALKASLSNWRTWLFTAGYMVIVGSSTLSYFYPTLVKGLGYSSASAQYMTVPIYGFAFVCNALTGFFMDRFINYRGLAISIWLTFSLTMSILVCCIYRFTARYVLLLLMAAGLWSANALALSYASSTFGKMPREIRGISLAFVNAMGNLAQIYGAYLFPSGEGPQYLKGFSVISAMLFFGSFVYLSLQYYVRKYPPSD